MGLGLCPLFFFLFDQLQNPPQASIAWTFGQPIKTVFSTRAQTALGKSFKGIYPPLPIFLVYKDSILMVG